MQSLNRDLLRRSIAPVLALVIVVVLAGAGGYLSAGGSDRPSTAPSAPEARYLAGAVSGVSGDKLTVTTQGGAVELSLAPNATIEVLRPTTLDRISTGDWLNGGAVPHMQTLLALVGVVVIPPSQLESPR